MSVLIGIHYEQIEPFKYYDVFVITHIGNKVFASGDVVKDFKDALKFCADRKLDVHYNSTVTNFLIDTDMYDLTEDGLLEARELKLLPMAPLPKELIDHIDEFDKLMKALRTNITMALGVPEALIHNINYVTGAWDAVMSDIMARQLSEDDHDNT